MIGVEPVLHCCTSDGSSTWLRTVGQSHVEGKRLSYASLLPLDVSTDQLGDDDGSHDKTTWVCRSSLGFVKTVEHCEIS